MDGTSCIWWSKIAAIVGNAMYEMFAHVNKYDFTKTRTSVGVFCSFPRKRYIQSAVAFYYALFCKLP